MREMGLHQQLTYWNPAGVDRYGKRTFSAPILIAGRWEDRHEEVTTIGGQSIVSAAVIYVDRDLAVGGYLAKGSQVEIADPHLTSAAGEIKAFDKIPDLRNVSCDRKAVL